ncbi:MAG: GNAT family N-acetyltransferase [Rhizobiaceae bacterium]
MLSAKHNIETSRALQQVTGVLGTLVSRFATSPEEVRQALALRYQVFCEELQLGDRIGNDNAQLDRDEWDGICDHLVIHETAPEHTPDEKLIATSRLMTSSSAERQGVPFYSQSEFDVASLMAKHRTKKFLELGRTCVLPDWRSRRCIELLWHSIWSYSLEKEIDVMIGCASFVGEDPLEFKDSLAYLYHNHTTDDEDWAVKAVSENKFSTNVIAPEKIDNRLAFRGLPPLIKGYLRLGAWVSREAVVDKQFGTIDILIILPVANLNPRHVAYYGETANRYSASRVQ